MKIVCLIQSIPSSIYMVNSIDSKFSIDLVVVENPKSTAITPGIFSRIWNILVNPKRLIKFTRRRIERISEVLTKTNESQNNNLINNHYFNNKWHSLNTNIPFLEVDSINAQIVLNRLEELAPDLIFDHGTSIVQDHILGTSKLALNIHAGISPYYRGAYCTEWALINWDPYNIGVTLHKLTKNIDGGDILAQERAVIRSNDNVYSINMQLAYLGTKLILKAIDKLGKKDDLDFSEQDYSLGFLTYGRQWSKLLSEQIKYIEDNDLIGLMLKKPSRKNRLKIVNNL